MSALAAGGSEDDVRHEVVNLIEKLTLPQGKPVVRLNYAAPGKAGLADIYCPGFRLVVETKAPGLAAEPHRKQPGRNETSFEQLARYVLAFRDDELTTDPGPDPDPRDWIGLLTDGQHWHGWRWAHHTASAEVEINEFKGPEKSDGALNYLLALILSSGSLKRPPVPSNLAEHLKRWPKELEDIHEQIRGLNENAPLRRHTGTKQALWLDMLRGSGMAPGNETDQTRLFIRHSFLVTLARSVVAALTHPQGRPVRGDLDTDGFIGWIEQTPGGGKWLNNLLEFIALHDWRARRQDVLREVYHAFVSRADRKVFGEFYTPDWLAELVVDTVLDEEWCRNAVSQAQRTDPKYTRGIGVLDPACGSGTFLYHAARRLLDTETLSGSGVTDIRKAEAVARLVNGIDIHPAAAEISRATLLRALPAPPPDGAAALHVYQGDALMINADATASSVFSKTDDGSKLVPLETPREALLLPKSFVSHPGFGAALDDFVHAAAENHGQLPPRVLDAADDGDQGMLNDAFRKLSNIIANDGNSVWAWYIRNVTAPLRLADRKVDRVVANPPWVKMTEIQVKDRKDALESRAKEAGLWVGGKQAPHFDIAQLFSRVVQDLYAESGLNFRGGWVVKKSALSGGNWQKFRQWHEAEFKDSGQSVDLEDMQPFGGGDATRSCLLFERCRLDGRDETALVMARTGKARPAHRARLDTARPMFGLEPAPPPIPQSPSAFLTDNGSPLFRQGATVVPHVLAVVETILETGSHPKVRTVKSDKGEWAKLGLQEGRIPIHWLRPLLRSDDMLPFLSTPRYRAIVPTDKEGSRRLDRPETESGFWQQLERHYENHRSIGSNTPKTLLANIDFAGKLTAQLRVARGDGRSRVVYPVSADIMRAARIPCGPVPIIGHTLNWWDAPDEAEALYLVAVLNAPCLEQAFARSRESGRHFVLHPWRKVPVARYDAGNPDHRRLAGLAGEAEEQALMAAKGLEEPPSNRRHAKLFRRALAKAGLFAEIDGIVQKLMPEQVNRL